MTDLNEYLLRLDGRCWRFHCSGNHRGTWVFAKGEPSCQAMDDPGCARGCTEAVLVHDKFGCMCGASVVLSGARAYVHAILQILSPDCAMVI